MEEKTNPSFSINKKGLNKMSFISFALIIAEFALVLFGVYSFYKKMNQANMPLIVDQENIKGIDVIEDTTAPENGEPVSEEVIDNLTAPNKEESTLEEVIDSLTAPGK